MTMTAIAAPAPGTTPVLLTPRRLLVLGGSRSLGDSARGFLWTGRKLREELKALQAANPTTLELPEQCMVLTGGANGPDVWTEALCLVEKVHCVVMHANGERVVHRFDDRGHYMQPKEERWGPGGNPLDRNTAVVEAAEKTRRSDGWGVRVVGVVDPWSKTRGTGDMLYKAKKAKLEPAEHFFPRPLRAQDASL